MTHADDPYRPLFDANPLPMWVYDTGTFRFLAVNAAAVAKYGWTPDEFLAMTILDIRPPDEIGAVRASASAAAGGLHDTGPWRHRRKDGAEIRVRVTSHPLAFNGRPARLVLAHDVTAQLDAQERLRQSERRLAAVLEAGGMGAWAWELGQNRAVWNHKEFELLGLPPQDDPVDADLFFQLVHPDDRGSLQGAIAAALDSGQFHAEFRVVTPAGEERWLGGSGRVIRDPAAGLPPHMFGVNFDITARKRAEERLRDSERLYRAVVEHSTDGLVLAARGVGATFSSPAVSAILGYPTAEFDRLAPERMHHPDDLDRVWQVIREAEAHPGRAVRITHRMRHADGSFRWIDSTVTDWTDDPAVGAIVINLRDVTDRETSRERERRTEEKLRQSAKMEAIGQLAGGVAHDFNNLLTVVGGFSELVLADLPADHPHRPALLAVRDAGERGAALTRQLLTFSRKQVVEPVVLDLNAAVARLEGLLRRLIPADVHIATALNAHPAAVRIDPVQAEQVLINLAVNARDAMPGGGWLTVETANRTLAPDDPTGHPDLPAGRYVRVSVTDTGHGMTDEVKGRIFEPFFTTKEQGKGTGLGLATVYGIVRQAGGQVTVYSEVGVGTTFHLLFPLVGAATEAAAAAAERPSGGTETVLLVEDEAGVRDITRRILEMFGYTVLAAENGTAALRLLGEHHGPIHLLLTDVVMPEMNGRQLVAAVRGVSPHLRVLYMSGYTDDAVVRNGILTAADHFLQKPFTPLALAAKVRAVLDAPPNGLH